MGLFDYVECEYPLPGLSDPKSIRFQTKDFDDPYMEKYRITPEGRLLREIYHREDRSDPEAEGFMKLAGCMTPVHDGWEDVNWNGYLNFYGDAHSGELLCISMKPETFGQDLNHPGPAPEWFEYRAKFTDGKVVNVERIATG